MNTQRTQQTIIKALNNANICDITNPLNIQPLISKCDIFLENDVIDKCTLCYATGVDLINTNDSEIKFIIKVMTFENNETTFVDCIIRDEILYVITDTDDTPITSLFENPSDEVSIEMSKSYMAYKSYTDDKFMYDSKCLNNRLTLGIISVFTLILSLSLGVSQLIPTMIEDDELIKSVGFMLMMTTFASSIVSYIAYKICAYSKFDTSKIGKSRKNEYETAKEHCKKIIQEQEMI